MNIFDNYKIGDIEIEEAKVISNTDSQNINLQITQKMSEDEKKLIDALTKQMRKQNENNCYYIALFAFLVLLSLVSVIHQIVKR